MRFDDLDAKMRIFETASDHVVLPGIHIVARLDGRGFTRLTKEVHRFEAPFDERFRDLMIHTLTRLMECGFRTIFGYTQSDEVSLLLHRGEEAFGRKERKLVSVLAGEASAVFSLRLGAHAAFDGRLCQFPNHELVEDYFRWRQADAHRNALNAHCYWIQRREGASEREATRRLSGKSVAEKNEFLFQRGVNFDTLPAWQKRGVGIWWTLATRQATNPLTGESVVVERRELKTEIDLPLGEDFGRLVLKRIEESERMS